MKNPAIFFGQDQKFRGIDRKAEHFSVLTQDRIERPRLDLTNGPCHFAKIIRSIARINAKPSHVSRVCGDGRDSSQITAYIEGITVQGRNGHRGAARSEGAGRRASEMGARHERSVLGMETKRADVPNWDSFQYVNFTVAVEFKFGIKFRIADVEAFETVGDIVVETKTLLNPTSAG